MPSTPFLGRERELAAVVDLVRDARLLTLTGPGGTGKTRLALQAAAEVADDFPDGVWWVPLAPLRDPEVVLRTISQSLEIKEQPGQELTDTLAVRLEGKHVLVVLDNAEHLMPDLASLLRLLHDAAPALSLLVTSRERLRLVGEQVYAVPSLAEPEAVALFLSRAAALGSTLEPSNAVRQLCLRLDNLPLALELAAARGVVFSPEQLLERLGQRLDLLRGERDADPRQQALRATIDWSYQLLDQEEQRLFRALSVFAGGCTYEAAEEVAGADPDTQRSRSSKPLPTPRARPDWRALPCGGYRDAGTSSRVASGRSRR